LSVARPQALIPSATGGAHPLDLAFIDEEALATPWKAVVPQSRLRGPLPTSLTLTLGDRLSVARQGRLHRQQGGKTSVRMIDWLDLGHAEPQRMWERWLRGYRAMEYELTSTQQPLSDANHVRLPPEQ
jgi:hypothetical protein